MELPSVHSFFPKLHQCKEDKSLLTAQNLHFHAHFYGLDSSDAISNHFIPLFLQCGSISEAHRAFSRLAHRNEYSWTSIIHGYIHHGRFDEAFSIFHDMQEDGVCPNIYTYPGLLKGCSKTRSTWKGQAIHTEIIKYGLENDGFVGNSLVDMYAKCGLILESQYVFDRLNYPDSVSWNSLIGGFVEHGLHKEALISFQQMKQMDMIPSVVTYICGLKACASLGLICTGQEIHVEIIKEEYENDAFLASSLVDMYAKCGWILEAKEVFDELNTRDVVTWTALMAGYAECGFYEEALKCLEEMQIQRVIPNVVSWNSAIMGLADQGESERAFVIYAQMQEQGVMVNSVTSICTLKACGITANLRSGKRIHAQLHTDVGSIYCEFTVLNAVIDMYCKCGSMVDAQYVFDQLPKCDLLGWSSLIAGYVSQGELKRTFRLLGQLIEKGIQPDGITFLSVLTICSHAGLVLKGQGYFQDMGNEYGIVPDLTHYNSVLDLMARAGQLDEAIVIMDKMPCEPNVVTWSILLGACQRWGNAELGQHAFNNAMGMDEKHSSAFVLMSNMFIDFPSEAEEGKDYLYSIP